MHREPTPVRAVRDVDGALAPLDQTLRDREAEATAAVITAAASSPRKATSKTCTRSYSGMPPHSSVTAAPSTVPSHSPRAATLPPEGVCRTALSNRLRKHPADVLRWHEHRRRIVGEAYDDSRRGPPPLATPPASTSATSSIRDERLVDRLGATGEPTELEESSTSAPRRSLSWTIARW